MNREFVDMPTAPTKASAGGFLKRIQRNHAARPQSMVFFGPPGIGKTSVGASIPRSVFMIDRRERGIETLKSAGLVGDDVPVLPIVETWDDVMGMLGELATADVSEFSTLVIDTLGGLEILCHDHCRREDFDNSSKKFVSYHAGYKTALVYWNEMLSALDRVRDNGLSVVALAHAVVRNHRNPMGDDYDEFKPDLANETWAATHKWADSVLFATYEVTLSDKEAGSKKKAKGGHARVAYCQPDAAYTAKNRLGLPFMISLGNSGQESWANISSAIKEAKETNA